MSGSPEARSTALRALEVSREGGVRQPGFMALIVLLRLGGPEPTGDPEQDRRALEALIAEAQALHDAQPERQPRSTVMLHGSLAHGCVARGEGERALGHYRDECAAARRAGFKVTADAAESNIAAQLVKLNRLEEALALAEPLVSRLRASPDENANLVYAWHACVGAQTALGHYAQVRAGAMAYWQTIQRYATPHLASEWVRMLALEGRHRDAALLLGFLQRASERASTQAVTARIEAIRHAHSLGKATLDAAAWEAAVAEGREMDEADALALLGVELERTV
jgi:hypothetical protein